MKLKELADYLSNRRTYMFRDKTRRFIMSCSTSYLDVTPLKECEVLEIDGTDIILEVEGGNGVMMKQNHWPN